MLASLIMCSQVATAFRGPLYFTYFAVVLNAAIRQYPAVTSAYAVDGQQLL